MTVPSDAMAAEFDTVAEWTAQVAGDLGAEYAIPAGCRGSGSPGALHWLLDRLDATTGRAFLDCGAGVGGPAAFAAQETGVRPVLTEPEAGACRAASTLFGLPTVQAGTRLPIATGSVSAGWSLGVLCTVDDQTAWLAELRRVLHPAARFGLLVYTATRPGPLHHEPPEGNNFPTADRVASMLAAASLRVVSSARTDDSAAAPSAWQQAIATVESELRRRHGSDPRWETAERQSERMGRLLQVGDVVGALHVVAPV